MASIEQLIFEIIARDRNASKAFDSFRRSVDSSSTSVDKNTASLDKNTASQEGAMGGAAGLGAAFSAMTSPLAAAGAGAAAFGALAAPSVMKVSKALSGPGGLTAAWGSLDNRQRNMALGVQTLGHRFAGLAAAMEPRVAQTFGTALGIVNRDLTPFSQLAANAGKSLEGFLVQFSQQSGLTRFIGFMSKEAGPAITLLGTDITNIAHSVFALLQSWGGLGLAELKAVTFVISGVTGSLTWLATHAPGITSAAIAIGGVALALSKLGLLSGVLKITGIAAISEQMTGFMAATKGATLAEKGLLATTTALDAINPLVWVAAAAVAVGVLVDKVVTYRGSVADLTAELAKQDSATGVNAAGYKKLAQALGGVTGDQAEFFKVMDKGRGAQGGQVDVTDALTAASRRAAQMAVTLTGDFRTLGARYGITAGQAKSLVVHAGAVNDIIKAGGRITPQAAAKIDAYARANMRAQRPTTQFTSDMADFANKTLTATDRTKALTDALNQFFNPAVTFDQSLITLKNDAAAMATALTASGGKTGLLTQKQRDARGAFDTYIQDVADSAQKAFDATGKTSSYTKVINNALPALEKAAGKNKALQREVQRLIDTEHGLRSEHVAIQVSGTGSWSVTGVTRGPGSQHPHHHAAGWRVPGWGGGDRWPAMLEGGEAVVPKHLVPPIAPFLGANRVPGFASGGVAGSYRDGIAGLTPWLVKENSQTLAAMERAVAHATLAAIRQGPPGGTGGFGGAGVPGGSAAMNARLAQLMMPSWATGSAWNAWNYVAMRESGWNQFADNKSSGAYGIPQALPFTKMPQAAWPSWAGGSSSPVAQIGWMISYILGSYGSPQAAAAHEASFNWYGNGLDGIFSRRTLIGVGDRGPEHVQVTPAGRGGQPVRIVLSLRKDMPPGLGEALLKAIRFEVRDKGGGDVQAALGG